MTTISPNLFPDPAIKWNELPKSSDPGKTQRVAGKILIGLAIAAAAGAAFTATLIIAPLTSVVIAVTAAAFLILGVTLTRNHPFPLFEHQQRMEVGSKIENTPLAKLRDSYSEHVFTSHEMNAYAWHQLGKLKFHKFYSRQPNFLSLENLNSATQCLFQSKFKDYAADELSLKEFQAHELFKKLSEGEKKSVSELIVRREANNTNLMTFIEHNDFEALDLLDDDLKQSMRNDYLKLPYGEVKKHSAFAKYFSVSFQEWRTELLNRWGKMHFREILTQDSEGFNAALRENILSATQCRDKAKEETQNASAEDLCSLYLPLFANSVVSADDYPQLLDFIAENCYNIISYHFHLIPTFLNELIESFRLAFKDNDSYFNLHQADLVEKQDQENEAIDNDYNAKVQEMHQKANLQKLQQDIDELVNQKEELRNRINTLTASITELQDGLIPLRENRESLMRSKVALGYYYDPANVDAKLKDREMDEKLRQQITELDTKIALNENTYMKWSGELSRIKSDKRDLNTQIQNARSKFSIQERELQNEISDAETKLVNERDKSYEKHTAEHEALKTEFFQDRVRVLEQQFKAAVLSFKKPVQV